MPEQTTSPIDSIDWQRLDLDPLNPRLVDQTTGARPLSQNEAAERLMDDHDPIAIGRSMARFGFFVSDPLIALKEGERYIVVEGNRRLLTIRILLDESTRDQFGNEAWNELAADLSDSVKVTLERLPVQVVSTRDEAAPVIGFRHIVGIKKWDAYEKAAFVRGLIASQSSVDGVTDDEIFERVSLLTGESPARVRTYLRDYTLLRQAESAGVDVTAARAEFGVFTRALSSRGVRTFIDAAAPNDLKADAEEAYAGPDSNVQELLEWMHGPDPVFTDARRLKDLGRVLESADATEHLRATHNLDEAEGMTGAVRDRVLANGQKALAALRLIAIDVSRITVDGPVVSVLGDIVAVVASLPVAAASSGSPPPAPVEQDEGYDLTSDDDELPDPESS